MTNQQKNGSIIAIITMFFLYAMIAFVTNLAAPVGVIWKGQFAGMNTVGMLGNLMNFLAYLFMGIPAGKMLINVGYKKTALIGIAVGFIGVLTQFLSGVVAGNESANIVAFVIYLLGAFICGFSVCMLNTVVNPMLNLIGGGGNRGNQLNLIGGTLNSLSGTMTPMLVGALVGQVVTMSDVTAAKEIVVNGATKVAEAADVTTFSQINPVLYIAMAVFAVAFIILNFIPITEPAMGKASKDTKFEHSPWSFRHCKLGVIAIFVYVGVEIGIPSVLNLFISDENAGGAGLLKAAEVGGSVAATYWLLMLIGRLCSSFIANKVSSKMLMTVTTSVGMILIICAMLFGTSSSVSMPVFNASAFTFEMQTLPIAALFLVLCGLCTSIMWSSIFNLATEGLGKYTAAASGIFMMMVVGGGILPLFQGFLADNIGYMLSYIVPLLAMAYMCWYAVVGSKNVNTDIPVE